MGLELIFAIFGAVAKVVVTGFAAWTEHKNLIEKNRHEREMAAANRPPIPHEHGFDTANSSTLWTRRILALQIIFTLCLVQAYCFLNAGIEFSYLTSSSPGIFDWLFGYTADQTIKVSLGQVGWDIVKIQFMVAAFYFTPAVNSKHSAK